MMLRAVSQQIGYHYYCGRPLSTSTRRSLATIIVSRSKFRLDHTKSGTAAVAEKKKEKVASTLDDKNILSGGGGGGGGGWPRSVVVGFFATMSVVVPYTASWYLSQNGETRDQISSIFHIDDEWWDPIRRRFGERDYAGDENTYKFEDEPDSVVRKDQVEIRRRGSGSVTVKIAHLITNEHELHQAIQTSNEHISVLPASVLARQDSFSNENSLIALEFPDEETTETKQRSDSAGSSTIIPTTSVPYQVYSSWHYHPPEAVVTATETSSRTNGRTLNQLAVASELEYINAELTQLDQELKQGRSMDDPYVQDRMRQLKADRRRLQWKKWWGS